MLKKILVILAMLYAAAAFAAVDVNKATAAELDGIKGIGPSTSKAIVDERKKGDFKNWEDLITRVKGIGEGNAAKFSAEGMTVKGEAYKKVADTKKDDKKAAKEDKKDDKTAAAKPAASTAKPTASAAKPADAAAKPASAAKK
jgi:competence protein ComEA